MVINHLLTGMILQVPYISVIWYDRIRYTHMICRIKCVCTLQCKNRHTNPWNKKETSIWVFPQIGVPQNGWFRTENPIKLKWMIWGYPYFWKHPYTPTSLFTNIFQPSQRLVQVVQRSQHPHRNSQPHRNFEGHTLQTPENVQRLRSDSGKFVGGTLGPTWEIPI